MNRFLVKAALSATLISGLVACTTPLDTPESTVHSWTHAVAAGDVHAAEALMTTNFRLQFSLIGGISTLIWLSRDKPYFDPKHGSAKEVQRSGKTAKVAWVVDTPDSAYHDTIFFLIHTQGRWRIDGIL